MTNRRIFAILIVFFILGLIAFIRLNTPTEITGQSIKVIENQNDSIKNNIEEINLEDHSSEQDCWVGYDGKIYDLTSWLHSHPGGANRIIPYCGNSEEFEKAFTRKHGTSQVSTLMRVATLIGDLQIKGEI